MKYKQTYGDKQREAQKRRKEEERQGEPQPQPASDQVPEDTREVKNTGKTEKNKKRIA
jgi:hypothetical protein